MSLETYTPELQQMIDRAGKLTGQEAEALGTIWKSNEDIVFPKPDLALEIVGEVNYPVVTNPILVEAWERVLDTAGKAGRVDAIRAAEDAGKAATHQLRHVDDDAYAKDGAEEAVRSAVLATGVRDLVTDDDYRVLTAAWEQVLGTS
ncbi:hypothetical protein [Curtobacterium sp. ISL-83]|uniref:hypothetical protein n=1 Tax=Curtobacterium sp. ISL-83 TaxID=2819145 RepID=UPI001BE7535A|nr:hypothetical protein [Curtobacterium sp. ISL-83]MBT2501245.1 hypothetical protein [Curtobacterium sp. ISL-83]